MRLCLFLYLPNLLIRFLLRLVKSLETSAESLTEQLPSFPLTLPRRVSGRMERQTPRNRGIEDHSSVGAAPPERSGPRSPDYSYLPHILSFRHTGISASGKSVAARPCLGQRKDNSSRRDTSVRIPDLGVLTRSVTDFNIVS